MKAAKARLSVSLPPDLEKEEIIKLDKQTFNRSN